MLPFKEKNQSNHYIREFPANTNEMDLVWHMDDEDRIIESIGKTDWLFQFDDELPVSLNNTIFIPKHTIHRVIKGTGSLKIKLIKHG